MQEKSISLIEYSPDRGYQLCPSAQSFLLSLPQQPFAILAMVGKARTGKSYILNQILNQKAFKVDGRIGGCTKGIYISPTLRDNPSQGCKFLVIDSEGMGGNESTDQRDSRIFLLNMLLSSTLIYNSVGVIDEQAINGLSLVVGLGKALHQEIEEEQTKEQEGNFPSFFWLIRDFMLKLQTEQGMAMTSKEYLEKALEEQKGLSAATTHKNRIRRVIKGFFKERDCEALVRPADQEEILYNLEEANKNQIRLEFTTALDRLRAKIFKKLKPKKMKGLPITGRILVSQIKLYLQSFNHNGIPRVQSIWNTVCMKQSKMVERSIEESLQKILHSINMITLSQAPKLLEESLAKISKEQIKWVGGQEFLKQAKERYEKKIKSKKVQLFQKEKVRCSELIMHSQMQMNRKESITDLTTYYDKIVKQTKESYRAPAQQVGTFPSLNQLLLKIQNCYLRCKLSKSPKAETDKSKAEVELNLIKKQIKYLSEKNANLERQRSTLIRTIESQQKCIQQLRQTKNNRHQVASFGVLSSNKKQLSQQCSISAIDDPHSNGISVVEKVLEMYKKLEEKYTKLQELMNSAQAFICGNCSGRFDIVEFEKHQGKCKDQSPLKDVSQSMITLNKDQIKTSSNNLIQISNPSFFTPYLTIPQGILSVQISKTLIKQDSQQRNYVQYNLQVKLYQSSWNLNRKYRDFCELHDLLLIMFPKMQFPESSAIMKSNLLAAAIGGSSSSRKLVVEERRKMLEEYLRDLLGVKEIRNTRLIQKFLKINKEYQQLEYLERDEKSVIGRSSMDPIVMKKDTTPQHHPHRQSRDSRQIRKMKLSFNR